MERIKLAPKRRRPRRVARKIAKRYGGKRIRDVYGAFRLAVSAESRAIRAEAAKRLQAASDATWAVHVSDMSHGVLWRDWVMDRD
jgi:hypothetical protein